MTGLQKKTCDDAIEEAGVLLTSSGEVKDGVTYYIKQDTNIDFFDVSNGSTVIKPAYELSECKNDDSVTEDPVLHIVELQATDDAADWHVYVTVNIDHSDIGSYTPKLTFFRSAVINWIELDNCQEGNYDKTTELVFEGDSSFPSKVGVSCYRNCTEDEEDIDCPITISGEETVEVNDLTEEKFPDKEYGGILDIIYN